MLVNVTSGGKSWQMNKTLRNNLSVLKKRVRDDWNFKIIISGDGMTRTGKSTMAAQVAQFLDPTFAENFKKRMIFSAKDLQNRAYKIGKYKALVYDEARNGLDSKSVMTGYTKKLIDFFAECGNLNQIIIIVLPDYFELEKSVAGTQSICLINCYPGPGFKRGYFDFYNKRGKKNLYIFGKKKLNYREIEEYYGGIPNKFGFKGKFTSFFPFNKEKYEKRKRKKLLEVKKIKKKSKNLKNKRANRYAKKLAKAVNLLNKQHDYTYKEIGKVIGYNTKAGVSVLLSKYLKGDKNGNS